MVIKPKKNKRWFGIMSLISVLFILAACSGNSSTVNNAEQETQAPANEAETEGNELTIGYIPWDEDIAVTFLWKALLEEKGYKVNTVLADVAPVFSGVAQGSIDLFMDTWMPATHGTYMEKYGEQVEVLGTWYDQADNGLAVPDYVDAKSIEDLAKSGKEFKGQIIGIEPGAGLMRITKEAVPGYGLQDWKLVESSTPAMLSELDKAIANKEPIVVTLWRPHWAFSEYPLRYLEDPKQLMNPSGAEQLQVIASKGFSNDFPEVAKWIGQFKISADQLAKLESSIQKASNEQEGVQKWLEQNKDIANQWLK
ncbi:glycine betaine ABC transporter substrate-binding protein [Ammoniphilus sp. 3BR4]|uniref:glycine betaine ABC transporter substrate-binding protein n=1 Tax=Ammoniphilus sp. 3BR4 TaxID=3158265 RepID=UPI0034651E10